MQNFYGMSLEIEQILHSLVIYIITSFLIPIFDGIASKRENMDIPDSYSRMNPSHFTLEHEIFILDTYLNKALDPSTMEEWTRKFIDGLLAALRMNELGPLQIYPATDMRAPGWSFIQPITTSHISGHYFEKPGKHPQLRLDCYSCASINWQKIIKVCNDHMELGLWRATFIDRQIDEAQRSAVHISGEGRVVLDELDLLDHNQHLISARSIADKAKREMMSARQNEAVQNL